MAKPIITAEPNYDKRVGIYYKRIPINGVRKYIGLGTDRRTAKETLLELMLKKVRGELDEGKSSVKKNDNGSPDIAIRELIHKYLDWVEGNLKKSTYKLKKGSLNIFLKEFLENESPSIFWASELTYAVLDQYKTWAKRRRSSGVLNGGNGNAREVKTLIIWGWERDLCSRPKKFPKIHTVTKTREPIPAEHLHTLINHPSLPAEFKRHIVFGLINGLRPQELYPFQWIWIRDWDKQIPYIYISEHKTSASSKVYKPRMVPLSPLARNILEEQIRLHPDSKHPFLNGQGKAYATADAFRQRFWRWCDRSNIPRYCPYQLRHNWASIAEIPDPSDRMLLMGHSNLTTSLGYKSPAMSRLNGIMEDASNKFQEILEIK